MKELSSLRNARLHDRTALVRVGFDIEHIRESFRLVAALPTIKWLLKKRTRLVLLSHRGRPKRQDRDFSLKFITPFLKKKLGRPVTFLPSFDFDNLAPQIRSSKPGSVFLLENLRFQPGEEENDPRFARELAKLGDFYVNDAFSVCHRHNASITALPKFLPSYAGLCLVEEIHYLSQVMKAPEKPLVIVLGGAKVSDKLGLISYFLRSASTFLIGGATANTFLKAQGTEVKDSLYEQSMLVTARNLLNRSKKIILPIDFVFYKDKIVDVGPLSIERFTEIIRNAKTVIWNGPLGYFEDARFRKSSTAVAQAIMKSKAFSVAGGGETTELLFSSKLQDKFSFVSTGGGAMLTFLAGEKLPGITALDQSKLEL
jgi:phosphoglycerate kinase